MNSPTPAARAPQAQSLQRNVAAVPNLHFRFRLFPLGLITSLFDPDQLVELIREGTEDGYRMVRREFTIEPRRVLFFFKALAFGLVFRRDNAKPEAEHDWRVAIYKTRFFTRTVDTKELTRILNEAAAGGFEFHYGVKFPTRFLFFFPRESYVFIFRKPFAGPQRRFSYSVNQTPYRFFTRTLDADLYEADLNQNASGGSQLKVTFRDERRVFGMFMQPTAVTIFEKSFEKAEG